MRLFYEKKFFFDIVSEIKSICYIKLTSDVRSIILIN